MTEPVTYLEPQLAPKYRRSWIGYAAFCLAIPLITLGLASVSLAGWDEDNKTNDGMRGGGSPCGGCKGGSVGNSRSWTPIRGNGTSGSFFNFFGYGGSNSSVGKKNNSGDLDGMPSGCPHCR